MKQLPIYQDLFKKALRIRLVEEDIISRYHTDKIQSPVHLSIGQEAVAVGICEALTPSDLLFSTYRSHAFYLAKGGSLNAMMAELYGRVDGCCKGKGGSMHLAAPEVGFVGTSAVVASSISNAVGSALAAKLLNKNQINVVVFGDGATEEGSYHESLNYAALHQIPLIFVCENNQYAVHSSLDERQSYQILAHANTYGIETHKLESGYDFVAVADYMKTLVASVKKRPRPVFIEIHTCRYKEHVGPGEDFSGGYRTEQAVDEWKSKDPLVIDNETISLFKEALLAEIEDSVNFAENSPLPTQQHLLEDIF
ncbi:thiamine pyrophosphate-dependent dehydrogenase E1 component subunit alpha [Thalassotalea euphylliae]|uniref:Thiamine pyrophosphate-dependent dehydrogenase E1 component subunit alpha n=1 Tax=Thalassotalea euphylliae TaxID=1655234 RepID=A0A3E0UCV6_9GAMM|nr:thiamine pyrophosphate-dependent dehydrogenase E1 component subunit alpha [Thalassotalea euphylliae]REL34828.1 thiamine pyrophosphate-dependent dehydrogenase E1 component subunit alpha [Thalassotalea euphylliae]